MIDIKKAIESVDGKSKPQRDLPPLTDREQEIINHVGIPGMKWGIRKKKAKSSVSELPKKKSVNEMEREQKFLSEYSSRDKMSTQALRNRVNRLQTEQQFKELVNKPGKERAEAQAKLLEKRKKRNKMLLRGVLGVYGSLPFDAYGKKGKDLSKMLKPSQAMAKSISGSELLKNSEDLSATEQILLHADNIRQIRTQRNTADEEAIAQNTAREVANQASGASGKWGSKYVRKYKKLGDTKESAVDSENLMYKNGTQVRGHSLNTLGKKPEYRQANVEFEVDKRGAVKRTFDDIMGLFKKLFGKK